MTPATLLAEYETDLRRFKGYRQTIEHEIARDKADGGLAATKLMSELASTISRINALEDAIDAIVMSGDRYGKGEWL